MGQQGTTSVEGEDNANRRDAQDSLFRHKIPSASHRRKAHYLGAASQWDYANAPSWSSCYKNTPYDPVIADLYEENREERLYPDGCSLQRWSTRRMERIRFYWLDHIRCDCVRGL